MKCEEVIYQKNVDFCCQTWLLISENASSRGLWGFRTRQAICLSYALYGVVWRQRKCNKKLWNHVLRMCESRNYETLKQWAHECLEGRGTIIWLGFVTSRCISSQHPVTSQRCHPDARCTFSSKPPKYFMRLACNVCNVSVAFYWPGNQTRIWKYHGNRRTTIWSGKLGLPHKSTRVHQLPA